MDFEFQGQTFDHLIIGLKQPPNNVPISMHNIYVTLSRLCSLDGFIILRDIFIEYIYKAKFKKKVIKDLTKLLSDQKICQYN